MRVLSHSGLSSGKPVVILGEEDARHETLTLLADKLNTSPINLNIMLSEALMAGSFMPDLAPIIAGMRPGCGPMLLDRLQVLMLPQLQVNVVAVLCQVARRLPLCVSWPGYLQDRRLRYAHQDHPEFLDEDASRVAVIDLTTSEGFAQ